MKPFDELTDAELTALTERETAYYIDLACAEAGVPLLPVTPPGNGPAAPTLPTMNTFKVAGVLFTDIGDAQRLQEFIVTLPSRCEEKYLDGSWREPKYIEPTGGTEAYPIVTGSSLSEAMARQHKGAVEDHTEAKEKHEAAVRAYRAIADKRKKYADEIQGKISDAHTRIYRREEAARLFERYIELANGDRAIAARFFERAQSNAREVLPEAFESLPALPTQERPVETVVAVASDDEIPW